MNLIHCGLLPLSLKATNFKSCIVVLKFDYNYRFKNILVCCWLPEDTKTNLNTIEVTRDNNSFLTLLQHVRKLIFNNVLIRFTQHCMINSLYIYTWCCIICHICIDNQQNCLSSKVRKCVQYYRNCKYQRLNLLIISIK